MTDIAPPTTQTLSLASDRRVAQFWDARRVLSKEIVRQALSHPQLLLPSGERVEPKTVVWDFMALFDAGSRWEATMPSPLFYGYPVVTGIDGLRQRMKTISSDESASR